MDPEKQAELENEARAVEGEVITKAEQAGAPPGGEQPEQKPAMSTGQALTLIARHGFNIIAPAWKVSDDECVMLGESTGEVLDKYLADIDMGPEIAMVLSFALVFGPRWGMPRKIEPAKEEKAKEEKKPDAPG